MRFTFVMACWFRRCPACGFGLAASFRTSLSVVNRLIRPAGLPPAWTPDSPAHTRVPQFGARDENVYKERSQNPDCTLRETFRTELGPRLRVVAMLGKLSDQDLAAGWEDIEALLEGRKPTVFCSRFISWL